MASDYETAVITELLARSHDDIALFHRAVLGRPPLWSGKAQGYDGQVEWCRAIERYRVVACSTGNAVGKDFLLVP